MIKNIIFTLSFLSLSFVSNLSAQTPEFVNELQNKIDEFSQLGNSKVSAKFRNSVVILSGTVSNQEFKTKLLHEVREIKGVQEVVDEVVVDTSYGKETHSDQEIFDSISRELDNTQTPYSNLSVKNGLVSLSLDLQSFEKVDEVLAKLRGIPGVKDLKSDAKVKGAPYLNSVDKNY